VVKSSLNLEFDHTRENLKTATARVRSTRPLLHKMASYTIAQLKQLGLLDIGQTNRHVFPDGLTLVTTLAGKRNALKIRLYKHESIITLVSRPLGKGLVWYFQDPVSRRLVTAVYYNQNGIQYGRKSAGGLYASQFQSKCHRQLLRMDRLILKIDGDPNGGIGPARGGSKLKKLQDLSQIFSEVRAADRQRHAVLAKFPQLYYTICSANILLERELGQSHKSWVPSRQVKAPGHYSTTGLYIIPR
jgi:hypothetical protein